MEVEVRLFAGLRREVQSRLAQSTSDSFAVKLEQGDSVRSLLNKLGFPPDMFLIVLVNGISRDAEWLLLPEDRVGIFPPIGGG